MFRLVVSLTMLTLLAAAPSTALVEPETGVEYPDSVVVETPAGPAILAATGVGLREKTFLKADVYTVVSYVDVAADLDSAPAAAIMRLDAPKRLQMDMRRDVARGKLEGTLTKVIKSRVGDTALIAADLASFCGYFQDDARKADRIVFDYLPGIGLTTSLNGEVKGVIDNFAFVTALWSVWFGKDPEDDDLVRALVSRVVAESGRRD